MQLTFIDAETNKSIEFEVIELKELSNNGGIFFVEKQELDASIISDKYKGKIILDFFVINKMFYAVLDNKKAVIIGSYFDTENNICHCLFNGFDKRYSILNTRNSETKIIDYYSYLQLHNYKKATPLSLEDYALNVFNNNCLLNSSIQISKECWVSKKEIELMYEATIQRENVRM